METELLQQLFVSGTDLKYTISHKIKHEMEKLKSILLFVGKSLMWSTIIGLALFIACIPGILAEITNNASWLIAYLLILGIFVAILDKTING